jgi:hypothetical protein
MRAEKDVLERRSQTGWHRRRIIGELVIADGGSNEGAAEQKARDGVGDGHGRTPQDEAHDCALIMTSKNALENRLWPLN